MPNPQTDLLKDLSPDDAAQVWALGAPITASAGSVLFQLGEHAYSVYLVVRGRIALTLPMQIRGGEEDVLVEERLAGETLGWSGLIPPHRFTLKATAQVESELLALPRAALLDLFAANPAVGYTVTRNLAAVIGHRLEVFQTMWLREMQRVVELRYP
jgi:CRP/FNR family transcriptional regulator, cyclic AMP receptor protein